MRYSLTVIFFALSCGDACAQGAPEPLFRSEAPLVELHATVTGPDGHLMMNLPREAFHVSENDVTQEIKIFRHEDVPVSLGLIIDNSASMGVKRARVSAAVLTLIRASNPGDEAFIINFNERATLIRDFTQDPAALERSLAKIDSNGETALRDGLAIGLEHLKRAGKREKKVLVVVTDGEDNSSAVTMEKLSRDALQSGVLIYAIGLLSDSDERESARAKRDLDILASGTGGEVFFPKELNEVDSIARHVARDLRNQYTIAYSPVNQAHDGSFRRIQVTVDSPENSVVKTRAGYYSPTTPEP